MKKWLYQRQSKYMTRSQASLIIYRVSLRISSRRVVRVAKSSDMRSARRIWRHLVKEVWITIIAVALVEGVAEASVVEGVVMVRVIVVVVIIEVVDSLRSHDQWIRNSSADRLAITDSRFLAICFLLHHGLMKHRYVQSIVLLLIFSEFAAFMDGYGQPQKWYIGGTTS
jgi:hypothetical protein